MSSVPLTSKHDDDTDQVPTTEPPQTDTFAQVPSPPFPTAPALSKVTPPALPLAEAPPFATAPLPADGPASPAPAIPVEAPPFTAPLLAGAPALPAGLTSRPPPSAMLDGVPEDPSPTALPPHAAELKTMTQTNRDERDIIETYLCRNWSGGAIVTRLRS
jgi:hypothetical protein